MNAEDKRAYLLRFQRFQRSREQFFAPVIFKALRSQYDSFISLLQKGYTEHQAILAVESEPVSNVLKDLYADAAIVYGAKIRADLNRLVPYRVQNPNSFNVKASMPMGFSEEMRRLIIQYFSLDILNTSEGITEETKDLIRKVFSNAYEKGEGIDDIISQLKDTELSQIRARRIARTETVTSANQGALFVAKSSGLDLNKEWLSARDNRVRGTKPKDKANHVRMNGRTVGLDDYFNVDGYEMSVPGDRGGKEGRLLVPASEVVNCRCTTLFVPVL